MSYPSDALIIICQTMRTEGNSVQWPIGDKGNYYNGSGLCQEYTYADTQEDGDTYANSSKDQYTYTEADGNSDTESNQQCIWIYHSFGWNDPDHIVL